MKYKLFKVIAITESTDKEQNTITFNLPGVDENSIGQSLSKMDSIIRVISVIETSTENQDGVYDDTL